MATIINISSISDPLLEFGGVGEFHDPKEGLKHAGPFDLRFGNARKNSINIGFIGDERMVEKAIKWLKRCEQIVQSEMKNQAQYPFFLGFEKTFRTSLNFNPKWNKIIEEKILSERLSLKISSEVFKAILELFSQNLEDLSKLESFKPDVIFCCLSKDIIDSCWSVTNEKVTKEDKKKIKKLTTQLSLFDNESSESIEEQPEDILTRDFRRALKARAMRFGIPIQIGTDNLFIDSTKNQDASIRAWNSCIALYYKSGGIPWRLRREGVETCYVGISFHHLYTTHNKHIVKSCIAQAFSSDGEGFAIRGVNIPWTEEQDRDVHLTEEQAIHLGTRILEEYTYRTGSTPLRIVLHKSTVFNENEKRGLYLSLNNVPMVELVNLAHTDFRMVRFGEYPPKRGTLCTINNDAHYLFTSGYMDDLKTYPGPHIPVPFKINVDNSSNIQQIASDVLALSRMNWNTASITGGNPVTLLFSRKVGGIMAEYGDDDPPSSFRFYL